MTDWVWEYVPDADHVVGGLSAQARQDIERLAERLADAAAVRYLGDPPAEESGVSPIRTHAEGDLIVWYLEHRRLASVFVIRVQHWSP